MADFNIKKLPLLPQFARRSGRPPKGLDITLDAEAIRGAGYLFFAVEQARYAGVIAVEIPAVATIKAIGMITTRLPDGKKRLFAAGHPAAARGHW